MLLLRFVPLGGGGLGCNRRSLLLGWHGGSGRQASGSHHLEWW